MMNNKKKNIALVVAAGVLFLALLDGWQYGFFTLLRFVVFATTAYVAWMAYKDQKEKWVWIFGFISVLFNPFFPIHLTREVWVGIDFIVGAFLLTTVFFLKLDSSLTTRANQIHEPPLVAEPTPTPPPAPQPIPPFANFTTRAREMLVKARATIQSRKRKKLNKILILLDEKKNIANDDVEKLLHVSDATATRYLNQLEKEGKIIQVGKTGQAVRYVRSG